MWHQRRADEQSPRTAIAAGQRKANQQNIDGQSLA